MYTYHQLLSNHYCFEINAIMKCGTVVYYAGCLLFDWQCEKKIIVSLSSKYWWLVNVLPPSPVKQVLIIICVTCMFIKFCYHAHLGVRLESGSDLT